MARNKYPEETVQKILTVSRRLFNEKGYDNTTIQDIVDEMGMSKGAIYHHFKSKEEILYRLGDIFYDDVEWFKDIRSNPELSGLDKIRRIFLSSFSNSKKNEVDRFSVSLEINPKMAAKLLENTMEEGAPFIQELVEEGIRDGSIAVRQPQEFSEALLLLFNVWIGIFTSDRENYIRKLQFIEELTNQMGLPLFDGQIWQLLMDYYNFVFDSGETSPQSGKEP